jgi:hypothetical protein
MVAENLHDSLDAGVSRERMNSYSTGKNIFGVEWLRRRGCRMSWLAARGIEGALNARFGFWRETGHIDAIILIKLGRALTEDVTEERQLLLVSPAEETDAEMPTHAQACVPRQRSIHRIGQQPRHVLA